jgi:hypothetical protein
MSGINSVHSLCAASCAMRKMTEQLIQNAPVNLKGLFANVSEIDFLKKTKGFVLLERACDASGYQIAFGQGTDTPSPAVQISITPRSPQ